MNPLKDDTSRNNFLSNFKWSKSVLSNEYRQTIEEVLLEYNDIFARHEFDIGGNDTFTVKLTPEHHNPIYTQSSYAKSPTRRNFIQSCSNALLWVDHYFALFEVF